MALFSLLEIAHMEYIRCSLKYTITTLTLSSVAIYRNTSIRIDLAFFLASTLPITICHIPARGMSYSSVCKHWGSHSALDYLVKLDL